MAASRRFRTVLSDGTTVEAATVGDEGMLGIEAFLGRDAIAPGKTLMLVPGTNAEMLSVEDFQREVAASGALHDLMGRYTQVIIAQLMQSTACSVKHQVQQRCAHYLLMTHDRMHEQDFQLSHELLATMLGVRRPTVSVAAAALQEAGLIRYLHGRVTVRNRKKLTGGILRVLFQHPRSFRPTAPLNDSRFGVAADCHVSDMAPFWRLSCVDSVR